MLEADGWVPPNGWDRETDRGIPKILYIEVRVHVEMRTRALPNIRHTTTMTAATQAGGSLSSLYRSDLVD